MAQNQRAPGTDVINVLIAVRVPEVGALSTHDKRGIAAHSAEGANRGGDSTRDQLFRSLLQLSRLLEFAGHRASSPTFPRSTNIAAEKRRTAEGNHSQV